MSLGLNGLSFLIIWFSWTVPLVVIGAAITTLGSGVIIPTLLIWVVSGLQFDQCGRGTGPWTGFLFFGQLAAPLVVLALGA